MLIRFRVANFLSFNEEVEFSMIAGSTQSLPHHVIKADQNNGVHALKAGIIYGANASGKSNLIKAIHFAQQAIIQDNFSHTAPFKLDPDSKTKPSKFEFEIKIGDKMYAYGFELIQKVVLEEWLFEINKTTEKALFERTTEEQRIIATFGKGISFANTDEQKRLQFIAEDTLPNQLLLSMINQRNTQHIPSIEAVHQVYQWFNHVLTIVFPYTSNIGENLQTSPNNVILSEWNSFLDFFNTGVKNVRKEILHITDMDELPSYAKKILTLIPQDYDFMYTHGSGLKFIMRNDSEKGMQISRFITQHYLPKTDQYIDFESNEESDGTNRIIDLIPALSELQKNGKVYVIDEIDRSLHPMLTRKILDYFFTNTQHTNSQLIATTHESSLLDLGLLRKDEIWFVEKNKAQASTLYSLEEFKPRKDKVIRKGYLQGRYGAIPIIGDVEELGWKIDED